MEEQLNSLAVTHLLQHTLRSLCIHETSQWVYAVFWRILPRNYPPPRWDLQGGAYDRTRGNRRNWILVWEDGFCNFAASACEQTMVDTRNGLQTGQPPAYGECELKGLQPELFFKMSHEIYNYGEGLIGKVAADHSHKWVFKDPQDHEINLLTSWSNPADSQPRTWEAQFQAGIKTIALIAVREGVVQLGAVNKVTEDLSFVVLLRKKFHYLESIPGVLLPHPSSAAFPLRMDGCNGVESWPVHVAAALMPAAPMEFYDQFNQQVRITPSMSSLEALLSNLPSVGPSMPGSSAGYYEMPALMPAHQKPPTGAMGLEMIAKEEVEEYHDHEGAMKLQGRGESSSMSYTVGGTKTSDGF